MTAPIIAEHGFNSGRMYGTNGQEIYYWVDDDGYTTFYDRTRMIIGTIRETEYPASVNPRWVMKHYDAHNYDMACQPARIPAGYDFGEHLDI